MEPNIYTPVLTREQFLKLTKRQQRVAIAEDVLARLNAKLLIAQAGTFVEVVGSFTRSATKEVLNSNQCHACAKGALVCAWLGTMNEHTVSDFSLDSEVTSPGHDELLATFGKSLYDALERLFEGWETRKGHGCFVDTPQKLKSFNRLIDKLSLIGNDDAVLQHLMNNLITNKGRLFIPGVNKKKGYHIGS